MAVINVGRSHFMCMNTATMNPALSNMNTMIKNHRKWP